MLKKFLLFSIIFAAVLSFSQPALAQTATLYFSPQSGTFEQGQSFWLTVMVNTKGEAVNAVAAYFSYPEDKLTPLGVNTSGSVMTIFAEKQALAGKVEIAGGLPSPGFSGIKKIASVGFKVKASSGSVNFKFSEDSAVLTDADNKNILSLTLSGQGNYEFKPKTVPLPTQPPPAEIQPPLISKVNISNITQHEATIFWQTDKPADSQVVYGLTPDYGLTITDEELTKEHSLLVSALSPGTLYHFKVKSALADGEITETKDSTFSTLGYQVEIRVLNLANNQPLVGAKVVSSPPGEITKVTDEEGKAVFDHLAVGQHWLSVQYEDTSLSYLIDVQRKEEIQRFELKFRLPQPRNTFFIIITFAIIVIIVAALVFIFKKILIKRSS